MGSGVLSDDGMHQGERIATSVTPASGLLAMTGRGGRYGKRCVERRRNEYVIVGNARVSGDDVAIRFSGRGVTSHTAPTDNWLLPKIGGTVLCVIDTENRPCDFGYE